MFRDAKIVSERLGHANIGITLDQYSHVSEQMQTEAAEGLEDLIAGAEIEDNLPSEEAQ